MLIRYDDVTGKFYKMDGGGEELCVDQINNKYPYIIRSLKWMEFLNKYGEKKYCNKFVYRVFYCGHFIYNNLIETSKYVINSGHKHIIYLCRDKRLYSINLKTWEIVEGGSSVMFNNDNSPYYDKDKVIFLQKGNNYIFNNKTLICIGSSSDYDKKYMTIGNHLLSITMEKRRRRKDERLNRYFYDNNYINTLVTYKKTTIKIAIDMHTISFSGVVMHELHTNPVKPYSDWYRKSPHSNPGIINIHIYDRKLNQIEQYKYTTDQDFVAGQHRFFWYIQHRENIIDKNIDEFSIGFVRTMTIIDILGGTSIRIPEWCHKLI